MVKRRGPGGPPGVRGVPRDTQHAIAEAILNGAFDRNAWLTKNQIAEKFGVTREQVRTVERNLQMLDGAPIRRTRLGGL